MIKYYWISTPKMTFRAGEENGIVVEVAPIAKTFLGQPFQRLVTWASRQGGLKIKELTLDERLYVTSEPT